MVSYVIGSCREETKMMIVIMIETRCNEDKDGITLLDGEVVIGKSIAKRNNGYVDGLGHVE